MFDVINRVSPSLVDAFDSLLGLAKEKASLQYALDHIDTWISAGVYPILFVWETGMKTALKDVIVGGQRGIGERGLISDRFDKFLEKTLHKSVEAI